jgi:hypothetical protein
MLRSFVVALCTCLSFSVFAALPAAPMNDATVAKINAAFAPVESQFNRELNAVKGDPEKSAEVIGRYSNWVFSQIGYSHDETVYKYLTDPSIDPFQKNFFAREAGLGNVIAQVASQIPGYAQGYLKSGALTQRTIDSITKGSTPATDAKEVTLSPIAGWQYPADKFVRESRIRMSLSPYKGEGQWAGYVMFRTYSPDDYYVVGERSSFDTQTLALLDKIMAAKGNVTVEGAYRAYQGSNYKICMLDRSKAVKLILAKPVDTYR